VVDRVSVKSSAVSTKMRLPDRHLTGDLEKSVRTRFSIIVPVFNEVSLIRPFLQHLRERAPEAEIIVADAEAPMAQIGSLLDFVISLSRAIAVAGGK